MKRSVDMRKPAVGISLKMYMNQVGPVIDYTKKLKALCKGISSTDLFVFPSMGTLRETALQLHDSSIGFGAQNIAFLENGALTGEYSIESLIEVGGTYVEIGHAERRKYFNESNEQIREKIKLALENNILPVFCIGETAAEKSNPRSFLEQQITEGLKGTDSNKLDRIIFAYEPVWAIGQAEAASYEYIHHSHQQIREIVKAHYGQKIADKVRIIYGGSVSKENAGGIVSDENVDGVFVGRFGHDPENFKSIVDLVSRIKTAK